MSTVILLDSGPLRLLTNPKSSSETCECNLWLAGLLQRGIEVKIPEIADYEVRRELLRAAKYQGLKRVDDLQNVIEYLPLTTQTMLQAAEFWAQIRKQGMQTAHDKALDGDVILAAQAAMIGYDGHDIIIAATNVDYLSRLANAKQWRDIP